MSLIPFKAALPSSEQVSADQRTAAYDQYIREYFVLIQNGYIDAPWQDINFVLGFHYLVDRVLTGPLSDKAKTLFVESAISAWETLPLHGRNDESRWMAGRMYRMDRDGRIGTTSGDRQSVFITEANFLGICMLAAAVLPPKRFSELMQQLGRAPGEKGRVFRTILQRCLQDGNAAVAFYASQFPDASTSVQAIQTIVLNAYDNIAGAGEIVPGRNPDVAYLNAIFELTQRSFLLSCSESVRNGLLRHGFAVLQQCDRKIHQFGVTPALEMMECAASFWQPRLAEQLVAYKKSGGKEIGDELRIFCLGLQKIQKGILPTPSWLRKPWFSEFYKVAWKIIP